MDRDTIFLYVIAVIASCFGLINCIQFFLKGNKTVQTVGTIISFKTINPENSKFRNSKWATVSYKVNGRTYQSQNCIQVPMASQIGTTITVRYDTQNPEKLYSFSILRIIVSLIVAAICIAAAIFNLVQDKEDWDYATFSRLVCSYMCFTSCFQCYIQNMEEQ